MQEDLARGAKGHTVGTHRLVCPEETLRRIQPKARSMGITRVANVSGLDVIGVPVVAVVRPNARSIAVAQGKGLDLVAAKVSGLMESIENYHAERVRRPLVLASLSEIRQRGPTIDVGALPRVAGSSFDPDARLLWIDGHEVMSRAPTWIPFEIVHADYTLPLPTGCGAFLMSDSGIASGNHPLEATTHAVCELVERDAVTLWHFLGERERRATRVDLQTVDDDACRSVIERFERAGVRAGVWDVTSDIGLPTFFCTILDAAPSRWRPLPPASGSGCHPAREIALLRALTEAAQVRLTVIAGSRDDLSIAAYARGRDDRVAADTLAAIDDPGRGRPFDATPTYACDTFAGDIARALKLLSGAGIAQVAVVDLAIAEIGIAVVRVVIPGLEGSHEAPGFLAGSRVRRRFG